MDNDAFLQLTGGSLFVVMILRLVFDFIKSFKNKKEILDTGRAAGTTQYLVHSLKDKISDLHTWHNQEDPNHPGAKIWWAVDLHSLIELNKSLTIALETHAKEMNRVHAGNRDNG